MFFLSKNQAKLPKLVMMAFCLFIGTACSQIQQDTTQKTYSNPYNLEFRDLENSTVGKTGIPIHFNPNPKKIYEITMDIQNSPMPLIPFSSTTINYYSPTEYNTSPVYSTNPGTALKVPISKIDDNTYKFILIEDAILDEDYGLEHYGKKIGVSHWEMDSEAFNLAFSSISETEGTKILVFPFLSKNLEQNIGKHTFFYEKKYATHNAPLPEYGRHVVGLTLDKLKNIKPSEIFSITVTVKKLN